MNAVLSFAIAALLQGSPGGDVQTICEFDGEPDSSWRVTGKWTIERSPEFVKSGTGSLRCNMGPPEKWPGPRIKRRALEQKGYTHLCCDIFSTADMWTYLQIRVDDKVSGGNEKDIHRSRVKIDPGWNLVKLDIGRLESTSGSRVLDPENLTLLIFHTHRPKAPLELIFDNLRFERPGGSKKADERVAAVLSKFKDKYIRSADYETRLALIKNLVIADVPERAKLLGSRVLQKEDDARLVREAIRTLGFTRDEAAVKLAIKLANRAKETGRWRWYEALGRMPSRKARSFLLNAARSDTSSPDQTAAIRALTSSGDDSIIDLLAADLAGSWQLRAARVDALRKIAIGNAFPTLVGFLKDPHPRTQLAAYEGLIALADRDFGDNAGLWLDWWEANKDKKRGKKSSHRPAGRAAYASYYGIPIVPGRVAFCIDVSGSMTEELSPKCQQYVARSKHLKDARVRTRIDLAKAELINVIGLMDERTHFNVIWYGTYVYAWARRGLRKATPEARKDAQCRVRGIDIAGYTNIHGALMKAFYPAVGARFKKIYNDSVDTIFLLSDGDPTAGEISNRRHLVMDVRERNRVRMIRINTIGMGRPNSYVLRNLASQSGGAYRDFSK
jgi:hypothetical protein